MSERVIVVRIQGPVKAGKSTVAIALEDVLTRHGIVCSLEGEDMTSAAIDDRRQNVSRGLKAIASKGVKVRIVQSQTAREGPKT